MRTFSDFRWEYIVKACESYCSETWRNTLSGTHLQVAINLCKQAEGLKDVVPKLREHPQLETLVPALTLMHLRWFPANDCNVEMFFDRNQDMYRIGGVVGDTILEETVVPLEEAADTVFAYITKYRQD